MNKGGTSNFKMSPEQIHEASQLFDTVKLHALAQQYGVTHRTLVKSMRREGLLRPKKRVADSIKLPPDKLELAIKMHLDGATMAIISAAVGSTEWTARRNIMASGKYQSKHERQAAQERRSNQHYNDKAAEFLSKPLRVST